MIFCTVKACTPEGEHRYTGLFRSTTRAMCDAYKRFGFHTVVTVRTIHPLERPPC